MNRLSPVIVRAMARETYDLSLTDARATELADILSALLDTTRQAGGLIRFESEPATYEATRDSLRGEEKR
jgi:hypothetical protein